MATNPPKPSDEVDKTLDKFGRLCGMYSIQQKDFDEAKQAITAIIERAVVEARIDELSRINIGRHYGKDYQDSMDALDEYQTDRLATLERERTEGE
jgi:hypothetical protein